MTDPPLPYPPLFRSMCAGAACIFVEVSGTAALKLMASVPGAKRAINRISLERQRLQIFKGGLTVDDLGPVVDTAEVERVPAGKVVLTEGEQGDDVYEIGRAHV